MKLIDKFLSKTLSMNNEQIGQNRLAVDFAKLEFEKKRFFISLAGTILTVAGLLFGLYQFNSNEKKALESRKEQEKSSEANRKSARETQFALKFFDLNSADRGPFIQNLKAFGDFDKTFITNLAASLTPEISKLPSSAEKFSVEKRNDLELIRISISSLTSPDKAERRAARSDLAIQMVKCASPLCLDFVNNLFEVNNLVTSERYRMALGISVALHQIGGDLQTAGTDFHTLFKDYARVSEYRDKLSQLVKLKEPAIQNNAKRALSKFK